jgi:hypothetical protein
VAAALLEAIAGVVAGADGRGVLVAAVGVLAVGVGFFTAGGVVLT